MASDPIPKCDALDDAGYKKARARVRRAVDKWVVPLGIKTWQKVEFCYDREFFAEERCGHSNEVVAHATAHWEYLTGAIVFSLPRVAQIDDDELDYVVRHEIAHLLVNQMREYDGARHRETVKHEEMVVTRLAQAFDWVRRDGYAEGQRGRRKKKK